MENKNIKFDFDDILIVPALNSNISSRYNDIELPKILPLYTAPMDTVVDLNNIQDFYNNKINIVLPRTVTHKEVLNYSQIHPMAKLLELENTFISFGFNELDQELKTDLKNIQRYSNILIDVANGHLKKTMEYSKEIKNLRPDITIMIGNIANPKTYYWYAENNCVDFIRIGVGNGNACLTTKHSTIGYPMASLIHETYLIKKNFIAKNPTIKAPKIIADGGMKNYSDIIKSLALGCDGIMVGSIFNKALESSSPNYFHGIKVNKKIAKYLFERGYPVKKYFRGMSTKGAQKAMGKTKLKTSEGVERYRNVEYFLGGWIENFEHYLRNAMSYTNCDTLDKFIGHVDFCQITENAYNRFNK